MSKHAYVKAYPKEFREQVVKLVQGGDRPVREVAPEFGVSQDSVQRWLNQAERDQGSRQDESSVFVGSDGIRRSLARQTGSKSVKADPWTPKLPIALGESPDPLRGPLIHRTH